MKEIQERQTGCQTAFTYNLCRELDGNLLQGAQTLLGKIDEINLEQLRTQDRYGASVYDIGSCRRECFHEVG